MKTKEKEIQKKIKELCELMGEDDKFFFFRKKGNVVDIALPNASEENDDRVSAALSSVIEAHFLDKGNEGVDRLSEMYRAPYSRDGLTDELGSPFSIKHDVLRAQLEQIKRDMRNEAKQNKEINNKKTDNKVINNKKIDSRKTNNKGTNNKEVNSTKTNNKDNNKKIIKNKVTKK